MTLDKAIARVENVADKQNEIAFELNTTYNAVTEYSKECSKCAEDHKQLAEWLKELKQLREQTRWIPVNEELPENGEEVMTCSTVGFIEIQSLENPYDVYWENQKGDWTDFDEVIAWMPLPEPYEPQKSEAVE